MCNRTQNDAIWELIALFLTNQIAGSTIDFKINVINNDIVSRPRNSVNKQERSLELQSCAKMFWKTSLDLSPVILPPLPYFFPPFPRINVGYFDDPSSRNTEITFFNIDMGVGGQISPYIPEKLKNMLFPKIFAHDCLNLS